MLSLDDPLWGELQHTYGAARDIPALLRAAVERPRQSSPNDEPWFSLWSSLCHQGDVYAASYAAVPHLVHTAIATPDAVDFSFFLLPTSIEVARASGKGPPIPDFLAPSYQQAIHQLSDCARVHLGEPWSRDLTRSIVAALAVAKGHHSLAEALMNLDDDWIARINGD